MGEMKTGVEGSDNDGGGVGGGECGNDILRGEAEFGGEVMVVELLPDGESEEVRE